MKSCLRVDRRILLLGVSLIRPVLALAGRVDTACAQLPAPVPAKVETPYTLMDDESRTRIEVGAEGPLRGNGPLTGYAYGFLTRPHLFDKDVYLRAVVAPTYAAAELIRDHWIHTDNAVGVGLGGAYSPPARRSSKMAASFQANRSPAIWSKRRWLTTCAARRSPASCRSRLRSVCGPPTSCMIAPAIRRATSACRKTPRFI